MTDILTTEIADGIATVTLNRPEKKNAMSLEMFEALTAAGEALANSEARAAILTGAGGAFCAGLDLQAMQGFAAQMDRIRAQLAAPLDGGANWFQRPTRVWQELPIPVIAAIEGPCLGAGIQLALAADFRVVAPDARLSIREAKWGLIPDMGITTTLPKLMRADQAKELMMTGRMLTGAEAAGLGLVTRLATNPLVEARTLAGALLGTSPDALAGSKRLVEEAWGGDLALEAALQAEIIGGANQIEAVMAAMQKRAPNFRKG